VSEKQFQLDQTKLERRDIFADFISPLEEHSILIKFSFYEERSSHSLEYKDDQDEINDTALEFLKE